MYWPDFKKKKKLFDCNNLWEIFFSGIIYFKRNCFVSYILFLCKCPGNPYRQN